VRKDVEARIEAGSHVLSSKDRLGPPTKCTTLSLKSPAMRDTVNNAKHDVRRVVLWFSEGAVALAAS